MHGKGSLVYPNNERYDGAWVYGKRHGCVGSLWGRSSLAHTCSPPSAHALSLTHSAHLQLWHLLLP